MNIEYPKERREILWGVRLQSELNKGRIFFFFSKKDIVIFICVHLLSIFFFSFFFRWGFCEKKWGSDVILSWRLGYFHWEVILLILRDDDDFFGSNSKLVLNFLTQPAYHHEVASNRPKKHNKQWPSEVEFFKDILINNSYGVHPRRRCVNPKPLCIF